MQSTSRVEGMRKAKKSKKKEEHGERNRRRSGKGRDSCKGRVMGLEGCVGMK